MQRDMHLITIPFDNAKIRYLNETPTGQDGTFWDFLRHAPVFSVSLKI